MKKTKHGDYERTVCFPIWSDYEVKIVFCEDLGKARKARYGTSGASDNATALHTQSVNGTSHLFFIIGNCPTGVVAHECWHAIKAMLIEWAGVSDLDNETVAYHLGYLVQKVADFRNDLIDAKIMPQILGVKSKRKG